MPLSRDGSDRSACGVTATGTPRGAGTPRPRAQRSQLPALGDCASSPNPHERPRGKPPAPPDGGLRRPRTPAGAPRGSAADAGYLKGGGNIVGVFSEPPAPASPDAPLRGARARKPPAEGSARAAGLAVSPAIPLPTEPRALLYGLRDGVRHRGRERCGKCGRTRIAPNVQIILTPEGRAHYGGILACGSIWECPVCAAKIKRARAEEITALVEAHGQARALMLTLTVRHVRGDSLRDMRRKIANAWRRFQSGRPWERFKASVGLVGTVRYLESTYGPQNGWHPHLHILLLATVQANDPRWTEDPSATNDGTWADWLSARWRTKVRAVLGPEHEPDAYHGARVDPCHNKSYLAKLGLELSDPFYKSGSDAEHRAPLELARDWTFNGDGEALGLWSRFTRDMFRARCHTWSKGLRERYGLREKPDEAIAEEPERGTLVHEIPGPVWDALKRRRGAPLSVLAAAENGRAVDGIREALEKPPDFEDWKPPEKPKREPVPLAAIDAEWLTDWQIERAKRRKAAEARPGPVRGLSRPGDVRAAISEALSAPRPPKGSTGAESNRVARDWYRSNADFRIAELRDMFDRMFDAAEKFDRSA